MDQQQQEVLQLRKHMGRLIADFWMTSDTKKRDLLLEQKRGIQQQIKEIVDGGIGARVEALQQPRTADTSKPNLGPTKRKQKQKQNSKEAKMHTQKPNENVEIATETPVSQKREPTTKRLGGLAGEAAYLEAKAKESQEVETGQRKRVKLGAHVVEDPEVIVDKKRKGPSGSNS